MICMSNLDTVIKQAIESNESVRMQCNSHIDATWDEFKDFKIKWIRTPDTLHFFVSDYLEDAPDVVVKQIFDNLLGRLFCAEESEYPQETINYLSSEEFRTKNRPKYLSRAYGFQHSNRLTWSLKRLKKRGLVSGDDIILGFANTENAGDASKFMKVAQVSNKLKNADKDVLDYAVYKLVSFIEISADIPVASAEEIADELIREYPNQEALEAKLISVMWS